MANPLLHQHEDTAQGSPCLKKRKLEDEEEEVEGSVEVSKLKQFQSKPIEENIDYISLKSSLSLLQSNLKNLERNIHELSRFKKTIKESNNIKEIAGLINENSNYLTEITYKGSCIKCPVINWNLNYGLKLEKLNDDDECYEKINEGYEILKKDKLFNC